MISGLISHRFTPADRLPESDDDGDNKTIIAIAVVLGILLVIAIGLIAFFLLRKKTKILVKEKVPALIWEDELLLSSSAGSDNSPLLCILFSFISCYYYFFFFYFVSLLCLFSFFICNNNYCILAAPSSNLKYTSVSGVEINKTELTFGLGKNDRFPVDKKLSDTVEITNISNVVKGFRVYVPSDFSRFECQV